MPNFEPLFQRPLITGASVSAGYGAASPGTRLGLRYTTLKEIKIIARNGTPGREMISRLPSSIFEDRTIVIAMDFFFWDSTFAKPDASLQALNQLVSDAKLRSIPLILGDIPELLPQRQPSLKVLNEAIRKAARDYENCFVLDLDALLKKVLRDGFIEVQGQRRSLWELLPDGLHLNDMASEFLAERILEVLY